MLTIKDAFVHSFSITTLEDAQTWKHEFKCSYRDLKIFLEHVEDELISVAGDADALTAKAKAVVTDILELKQRFPECLIALNCFQFCVASSMVRYYLNRGVSNYCFDWICNGISDQLAVDGHCILQPNRISDFFNSDNLFIKENFFDSLRYWVSGLYWYSNYSGGLKNIGKFFIDSYLYNYTAKVTLRPDSIGVKSLNQIIAWCTTHRLIEPVEHCSNALQYFYQNSDDREIKQFVALHYAVADYNSTGKSKREWCEVVMENYWQNLQPQQQLQVVINRYDFDIEVMICNWEKIITSIRNFEIAKPFDKLDGYHRNKAYKILDTAIFKLLMNGRVALTNELIGAYFCITQENLVDPSIFFVIPNHIDSIVYSFEGSVLHHPRQSESYETLVKLENCFLGITHQLNDVLDFETVKPERETGQPDPKQGNDFLQALYEYFNVAKLREHPGLDACSGYHLFNGTQYPLQPLMIRELNITFPLIHSFKRPKPARLVRRILIWQGETQLAEYERMGLKHIFESAGVVTQVLVAAEATKKDFIDAYHSLEFDIFWIISHGQFLHYESHKSYLDLGNDICVEASELHFKDDAQRRLLVLDACDGATLNMNNNAGALGIGPGLINAEQSLIGHCWPVRDLAGLIWGLLLATFLANENSYPSAMAASVQVFLKGKEAVLAHLRLFISLDDVLERIEFGNVEFNNFYYWGSIVYME